MIVRPINFTAQQYSEEFLPIVTKKMVGLVIFSDVSKLPVLIRLTSTVSFFHFRPYGRSVNAAGAARRVLTRTTRSTPKPREASIL